MNNYSEKTRKKSTSSKRRKKSGKENSNIYLSILFTLLFFIFPVLGLLIPYLVFRSNFAPVLTQKMADELVFVKYLVDHNSHTFAEGWISTKPFVPLSTRFFLTYYLTDYSTWKDALLKSVTSVYLLFCASYLFFVTSLHAKKFYTYIK